MTKKELETMIRLAKVDDETAERMRAVLERARVRQIQQAKALDSAMLDNLMENG